VPEASVRRGTAFAPAHVSGIFVPRVDARDPRARGSVGAGLVLSAGVTAAVTWERASRPSVVLASDVRSRLEISCAVARRLLAHRPGRLSVHLQHDLPIGQGFGSSAAGALATGLALASTLGVPRKKAAEVAHLADLFGGGGLGGVAAILGGGLELRIRPGIPPYGRVVRHHVDRTVLVGTVGAPIRSPEVLADPALMRRFSVGERLFEDLADRPTWERFWEVSERFTDEVGLAPPRLRAVVRGLRRRGAPAAQAMFGASFFASPPSGERGREVRRWLARAGITYRELAVARRGARTRVAGAPRRGRR